MRQNITIALLGACFALLVVLVVDRRSSELPVAYGQDSSAGAAGGVVVASGMTSSGSANVLWIYNSATHRLAGYSVKTKGIEFLGMRSTEHDMTSAVDAFEPPNPKMKPSEIKDLIDKAKR